MKNTKMRNIRIARVYLTNIVQLKFQKMMKKQLLTAALMLGGIFALTPSVADAKSSMDSSLKMLWMNTDVAPLAANARQGFGLNGKFYLQNMATQKIEVWDESGKIDEIASGAGTNITFDDAGNIIVRIGTFPNGIGSGNEMRIIPADGSNPIDLPLARITSGRADFWGHVKGNVMDKTIGGMLYTGTQWQPGIVEVPFMDGQQDVENTYNYAYTNPFGIGGNFATTTLISVWEDYDAVSMLSPHITTTNCNSIQKLVLDADENWVHDSFYITPRHNGCAGFYIFKMGEQRYIIYSSGSNNADGFTISKLATKTASEFEDSDESFRVATKYAEAKDDGTIMYTKSNTFYGNHFSAEVISDTKAYIYQYFPSGYIAKYEFTVDAGVGIKDTEATKPIVIGGNGEITIEGEPASIEVYTMSGILISRNEHNVKCIPGTYIVKTENSATKVMVK